MRHWNILGDSTEILKVIFEKQKQFSKRIVQWYHTWYVRRLPVQDYSFGYNKTFVLTKNMCGSWKIWSIFNYVTACDRSDDLLSSQPVWAPLTCHDFSNVNPIRNYSQTWVIYTDDLLSIKTILFDILDFWCQLEEIRFVKRLFETSHVRFIHKNFSVLITTPLDQIELNVLWKEACQATAKPADIVLETWFEEYPTPP